MNVYGGFHLLVTFEDGSVSCVMPSATVGDTTTWGAYSATNTLFDTIVTDEAYQAVDVTRVQMFQQGRFIDHETTPVAEGGIWLRDTVIGETELTNGPQLIALAANALSSPPVSDTTGNVGVVRVGLTGGPKDIRMSGSYFTQAGKPGLAALLGGTTAGLYVGNAIANRMITVGEKIFFGGKGGAYFSTEDGITITSYTMPFDTGDWIPPDMLVGICKHDDTVFMVSSFRRSDIDGSDNAYYALISFDNGLTFSMVETNLALSDPATIYICWDPINELYALAGSDGGGDAILTSPDGITWTDQTPPGSYGGAASICFHIDKVIIGELGGGVSYAADPTDTWTRIAAPIVGPGTWYGMESNGTIVLAVAAGGDIATSADGVTWAARTSGVATDLRKVAWFPGGSKWIAVGIDGVILTAPADGITWTERTSGSTNKLISVGANSTVALVVDYDDDVTTLILKSADGITWEAGPTAPNVYAAPDMLGYVDPAYFWMQGQP